MAAVTVTVIGAGAIGLACALQLRRAGVADVVVIDRNDAAGMGSTARANGGVRAQFSTETNITFSQYTIAGLEELDRLSGGLVGLRRIGYLFLAGGEAKATALRRSFELQRSRGVRVEWLDRSDVARTWPFLRTDGLVAATFCADDGVIDPHGVAAALHAAGRDAGVSYRFGMTVVGVEHAAGRAVVRCDAADVKSDYVVNAAGPHAAAIAAMADVDLRVAPFRHNLACTEAVAGLPVAMPMCVDADSTLHVRREGGGVLIGYAMPQREPSWDTAFDPAFLDAVAEHANARFPFLTAAPINPRKCWAGLYPETPDHTAIIDTRAEAPWFVQCAGFGGHGIMHSLAAGQAVAELVRDGRCSSFDLAPLRSSRFKGAYVEAETVVL